MKSMECVPDAGRAIFGFRDTGYNLNTAVADIVDNSINAKAENVWITLDKDPAGQVYARIIDDGYGMGEDELFVAMRYGAPERTDGNKLGRFGLGLKTASTAICRRLTVVSRKSKNGGLNAACWDLDLVAREQKWLLQVGPSPKEHIREIEEYIDSSGTMVCWDVIDRLGTRDDVDTEGISNASLSAYIRRLREHLELVYHRFMEKTKNPLKLWINGERLNPWNPFVPNENTDHPLSFELEIQIPGSKKKHPVAFNAYVIPNKYEYSTEDAKSKARLRNNLQGFYIYREDRIIIAADWLDMYSQEPHYTLLRAELSFPRELDELFSLDIKKSTLRLNPGLYKIIEQKIDPVRRIADKRYRQGKHKDIQTKPSPHTQSQGLIDSKYEETTDSLQVEQVGVNRVEVTNAQGTTIVTMPTVKTPHVKDLIEIADSIEDGLFWEPALINGRLGVRINRSHLYYERVYVPNFNDAVTVQGIDSILWALAKCEQEVLHKDIRKKLTDLRYFVSRTLRDLAEELPEVDSIGGDSEK